jgi:murein DD-endopeptidase MepM/ murein hydrolase activator NlpD
MNLKKTYCFLYVPDENTGVREVRVPRWLILGSGGVCAGLLVLAVAYLMGFDEGASWRPGGSPLAHENQVLQAQVGQLETRVAEMRGDLQEVFRLQRVVAEAVDLTPIDPETYKAGVGGRGPLAPSGAERELADLTPLLAGGRPAKVGREIDQLLRQARIQTQGFEAILDTLAARSVARQHLPSIRPCDTGWLSSRYGMRKDPFTSTQAFHRGIDFSLPVGSPVRVTGDGVVHAIQRQRGLGQVVKIDHGNGVTTVYAHLSKILVEKGQRVERGAIVAESGNSGRSTAPHLHYEIRVDGRAINPLGYILDSYASRN